MFKPMFKPCLSNSTEKEKLIDKIHYRNYLLINIALHLHSQFGTVA